MSAEITDETILFLGAVSQIAANLTANMSRDEAVRKTHDFTCIELRTAVTLGGYDFVQQVKALLVEIQQYLLDNKPTLAFAKIQESIQAVESHALELDARQDLRDLEEAREPRA